MVTRLIQGPKRKNPLKAGIPGRFEEGKLWVKTALTRKNYKKWATCPTECTREATRGYSIVNIAVGWALAHADPTTETVPSEARHERRRSVPFLAAHP